MTKLSIIKDHNVIRLKCEGHSGYGVEGTDIVCASVSTMVCAWIALCDELNKEDLVIIGRRELHDAYVLFDVYDMHNKTKYALRMMVLALTDIAEQYPQNLSVEWEEINFQI